MLFNAWKWKDFIGANRPDPIQQTPQDIQIYSLMPSPLLAKVQPLAEVRSHWPQEGLTVMDWGAPDLLWEF